jgi:hypothetical protein
MTRERLQRLLVTARGDEHEDAHLPGARAEDVEQQGGDGDAEHHAGHELQRAAGALTVGGADGDHRGDRRERGPRVRQQRRGDVPRDDRGGGRLDDREHASAQADASGAGGTADARDERRRTDHLSLDSRQVSARFTRRL